MKRLSIQDVQKYIDENANNQCTLLSTEYINNHTLLRFRCSCGKEFERTFAKMKSNKSFVCRDCSYFLRNTQRYDIEMVKKFLDENDTQHECTLLSTTYTNNHTKLKLRCNLCGEEFERDYEHLSRGVYCCSRCARLGQHVFYTPTDVEQDIAKNNYSLIGRYINSEEPVLCRCEKHKCYFNLKYINFLQTRTGCPKCSKENRYGPNSYNWKGGISYLASYLRSFLDPWKMEILKKQNFQCDITNQKADVLAVHHLNMNFSDVVQEAIKNTNFNLPATTQIKDCDPEELDKLKKELLKLHIEKVQGVAIIPELHNKFHSIYGTHNNTIEQYLEFKEKMKTQ